MTPGMPGGIRMIVADLDRTLLTSSLTISAFTAQVWKACRQRGLSMVYATARPERATRHMQPMAPPDYVIANNGSTIHKGERVIHSQVIPRELLAELLPALLAHPAITSITAEAGDCLLSNYMGEEPDLGPGWNSRFYDFSALPDAPICKLSVECAHGAPLRDLLLPYPGLTVHGNRGQPWHQITLSSQGKEKGVELVAGLEGIALENVLAFGDDQNDMAMLRKCGVGVAMDNSGEAVKAASSAVCAHHDADGVARWIARHVLS